VNRSRLRNPWAALALAGALGSSAGAQTEPSPRMQFVTGRLAAPGAPEESRARVFVDGERPSGPLDGKNSSFQLSHVPMPAESLKIFRNGVCLLRDEDFTTQGNKVQFPRGAPQPGDILAASYQTVLATVNLPPAGEPAVSAALNQARAADIIAPGSDERIHLREIDSIVVAGVAAGVPSGTKPVVEPKALPMNVAASVKPAADLRPPSSVPQTAAQIAPPVAPQIANVPPRSAPAPALPDTTNLPAASPAESVATGNHPSPAAREVTGIRGIDPERALAPPESIRRLSRSLNMSLDRPPAAVEPGPRSSSNKSLSGGEDATLSEEENKRSIRGLMKRLGAKN